MTISFPARAALLSIFFVVAGCGGGAGGGSSNVSALDVAPPSVTYVTPSNGASDVGTNTRLTVTFSEPMDAGSVASALSLVDDTSGERVAHRTDYDAANNIATLTPQPVLAASDHYRAEVSVDAKDLSGKALAGAYAWDFVTAAQADTTAPRVTSKAPAAGAANVATHDAVAMSFSEPMDAGSVGRGFTLRCDGVAVAGQMDYAGQAAAFKPDSALPPGATCEAGLGASATDLAGNSLVAAAWTFGTAAGADVTPPRVVRVSPADGSSDVPRDTPLSVTFGEPIYPFVYGSIDGVLVEVAIDYDTDTVSMKPTAALGASTRYDGVVNVRDLAGNSSADPYAWSFVTGP